jgi:hypothetical protein
MNTPAEPFKAEIRSNVAVALPDGGPKLTDQSFSPQIQSMNCVLPAGGLTPGSFAASRW